MQLLKIEATAHGCVSMAHTTFVPSISKGVHRQILGQVMDINYLAYMFSLIRE
jgi:hypothetical protein